MRTAFPILFLSIAAIAGLSSLVLVHPDEPLPEHIQDQLIPLFTNQTELAGFDVGGPRMSIAAADLDRDGWTDLAVSTGLDLHLYRNRGDRRFERMSEPEQFSGPGIQGLSWIDANQDRWPDLYLSGTGDGQNPARIFSNQGDSLTRLPDTPSHVQGDGWSVLPLGLGPDDNQDRLALASERHALVIDGQPVLPGEWQRHPATSAVSLIADEHLVALYGEADLPLRLFQVTGSGELTLSQEIPMAPSESTQLRGVALGDVDGDGDEDLYLAAGHKPMNGARARHEMVFFRFDRSGGMRISGDGEVRVMLWSNKANNRRLFVNGQEVGNSRFVFDWNSAQMMSPVSSDAQAGMHLSRKGDELVAVVVIDQPDTVVNGRIITTAGPAHLIASSPALPALDQTGCDQLWLSEKGRFLQAENAFVSVDCGDAADASFADFDNDGDLDLIVLRAGWPLFRPQSALYRNDGKGSFSLWDVPVLPNAAADPQGLVLPTDVDMDGRVDLLVAAGRSAADGNLGEGLMLWLNQGRAGNWLMVDLSPDTGDRFGLGSLVTVRAGGREQTRRVHSGDVARSGSILPLHFGIGDAGKAEITVSWPSGASRSVEVSANRRVRISESPQVTPESN